MAEKFVVVDKLTKSYDGNVVLRDVSFDVEQGEFFVIMGPSPCGKTVLLNTIAGLERPDDGTIYIGGRNMRDVASRDRDLSLVFQSFALFPHMSVSENISFGLKMRGRGKASIKQHVEDVIQLVGLEGLGSRYPRELSGGQQQRVALARSLVVKPKLLLLDEPLGSLDYKLQQKMQIELKRLHEKLRITFLYVTHSQEQALTLADRMLVMNQGRVEQTGSPSAIYDNPNSLFVARFVGEMNTLDGEIKAIAGNTAVVKTRVGELQATIKTTEPTGGKLVYAVRPEGIRLGHEARDLANRIGATFLGEVFKGSDVTYSVELPGGTEFRITQSERQIRHLKLTAGTTVPVGWDPGDVLLFPVNDTARPRADQITT